MSKYGSINQDLFAVFASPEWQLADILAVPNNYNGPSAPEYIRVTILPSRPSTLYQNLDTVDGVLMIDIFTPAGQGPGRASAIADVLDSFFQGKTNGGCQTFVSSLSHYGKDRDNQSLHRSIYSIAFKFNGA